VTIDERKKKTKYGYDWKITDIATVGNCDKNSQRYTHT
jgi:hypothetical protein